jgi:hypothetical protein
VGGNNGKKRGSSCVSPQRDRHSLYPGKRETLTKRKKKDYPKSGEMRNQKGNGKEKSKQKQNNPP